MHSQSDARIVPDFRYRAVAVRADSPLTDSLAHQRGIRAVDDGIGGCGQLQVGVGDGIVAKHPDCEAP